MNDKEWTNRDWKWLIGILIGLIIILLLFIIGIFSIKLSDNRDIANIISIGSGLVSIVLGIVAIIYSFIQTRDSSNSLSHINEKVDEIKSVKEKIVSIDGQLKNISLISPPYNNLSNILEENITIKNQLLDKSKKYEDLQQESLLWQLRYIDKCLVPRTRQILKVLNTKNEFTFEEFRNICSSMVNEEPFNKEEEIKAIYVTLLANNLMNADQSTIFITVLADIYLKVFNI